MRARDLVDLTVCRIDTDGLCQELNVGLWRRGECAFCPVVQEIPHADQNAIMCIKKRYFVVQNKNISDSKRHLAVHIAH